MTVKSIGVWNVKTFLRRCIERIIMAPFGNKQGANLIHVYMQLFKEIKILPLVLIKKGV